VRTRLDVSAEVRSALESGKPVVALESTIISHGFPYPANVECAVTAEQIARDHGVVPATIAIIGASCEWAWPRRHRTPCDGLGYRQGEPPGHRHTRGTRE